MRSQNSEQQQNKLAAKVTALPALPAVKAEKEAPATVTTNFNNSPQADGSGEERVFKCEQHGCLSSFKTRSSLRDHQKGEQDEDLTFNPSLTFSFPVHSDERPFPCKSRHTAANPTNFQSFPFPPGAFCSSAFKSSSNRSKHERGSHPTEYQKRKLDREHQRNGETEDSPPPKKIKTATFQQSPKVIKLEATASPKKANEFPCRYCDRVLTRADNRDKHEATHKDARAFGKF